MRGIPIAAALLASGCSILTMERLPDGYKGDTEPQCDTARGSVAIDVLVAVADGALVAAVASDTGDNKTEGIAVIALAGVVALASAAGGMSMSSTCKAARRRWERRDRTVLAPAESDRARRDRLARDNVAELARQQAALDNPPRGYYCASSSSNAAAGVCMRQRLDCETARGALVSVVADMSACVLTEPAYCLAETRCAPSMAACEAQRARSTSTLTCIEAR